MSAVSIISIGKWETETGESLEALQPISLVHAEGNGIETVSNGGK